MKKMKRIKALILLSFLLGLHSISFGQYIQTTKTQYSQTNDDGVGQENFSFSMSVGILTITDLDYSRQETYGPLKFESSGFNKGYYYEGYISDIASDPLRYRYNKPRVYKFFYDKKNGTIIAIIEGKIRQDNSMTRKMYYTELGNRLLNGAN